MFAEVDAGKILLIIKWFVSQNDTSRSETGIIRIDEEKG